jgi:hypothetical protein
MGDFIRLRDFMDGPEGWGRTFGRDVQQKVVSGIEAHPGQEVIRLSMKGVERMDVSFASEAVVELVRRYRGRRGICLVDLDNSEVVENIDAAAERVKVPVTIWEGNSARVVGLEPSSGNREALEFALTRPAVRAAEFAESVRGISIANASTKFKQLWEQGFLIRSDGSADSGGVEFIYRRIG